MQEALRLAEGNLLHAINAVAYTHGSTGPSSDAKLRNAIRAYGEAILAAAKEKV